MIEAYSIDLAVAADSFVPFNTVALKKGCTVELSGASSIQFNKCGIYMLTCSATASASTTLQLYKNGVAQVNAQSTGTTPTFTTLIQVAENNTCCPCTSPTVCQIMNSDAVTLTDIDIVVTKVV